MQVSYAQFRTLTTGKSFYWKWIQKSNPNVVHKGFVPLMVINYRPSNFLYEFPLLKDGRGGLGYLTADATFYVFPKHYQMRDRYHSVVLKKPLVEKGFINFDGIMPLPSRTKKGLPKDYYFNRGDKDGSIIDFI